MKHLKKTVGLLLIALIGVTILAGCANTKTYASDCALIVGRGVGDTRTVKNVIHPGQQSHLKGDDEQFVVPCNARNFLVTPGDEHGDRHNPATGTTRKVTDTSTNVVTGPGTPVKAYLRMYWTLNQDDRVLADKFFPLCRKYACASRSTDGGEDTANFSTPGWNGMLEENHSLIIDSAFQQAITQFDPNVWNEQEEWPKVAEAMAPLFMSQMRNATGTDVDLFCGTWLPANAQNPGVGTGKCSPVRFTITSISPQDPGVVDSYNASIKAQQDSQNRIAEIKRQENQVAAENELADKRAKLYDIPGYAAQIQHQYRLEEIQACGAAHLAVCPGSGSSGVVVNPR